MKNLEMINFIRNIALVSVISMIVIAFPAPAQQIVGINAAIKNKVQTRRINSSALQDAKLKGRVRIGDFIKTGRNGKLQILLRDRTSFTVGKNGQMTIDRFVYDPANSASEVTATVTKGAFRFISGKPTRNRKGRSSVKTPVGSIGIRGTIFEGAVGEEAIALARRENIPEASLRGANDEATFVILRGPGKKTQGDEVAGAVDLITDQGTFPLEEAGDAYFVPRKGARPFGPFNFSDRGFNRLQSMLMVEPARRPDRGRRRPPPRPPVIDRTFEVEDDQ